MNKLYLLAALVAVVCAAYVFGDRMGDVKCRLRINSENFVAIQNYQSQISKTKRTIHDTVYKMGADDVRRILRDKYTIGE